MKLAGSFEVRRSRAEVYAFLTDPARLAPVLPDSRPTDVRADGFTVEARVGAGPVRGTMTTRLDLAERAPNERAVYRGQAKGLGSVVDLEAGFSLGDAAGGGTSVQWMGDARVSGRLASVTAGMLEPLARRNLDRFISAVRAKLAD